MLRVVRIFGRIVGRTTTLLKEADMGKKELTEQELIRRWKQVERKSGKPVGVKAVCKAMGIKTHHVDQLLHGRNLTEFKQKHGIQTSPQETPYTPEQLLAKYDRLVSKYKKIPTWKQIRYATGMPDSTFKKKFGATQANTVRAYHAWLKKNKARSRNLKVVEGWLTAENAPDVSQGSKTTTNGRKLRVSEKTEGRTLGKPLNYENLVYGPANEQGVILLFAILSKQLRYNIEGIWPDSFPDCEATRVERGGKLRRVKIEFEFKSKDFVAHGHDPNACDVVVCWEDNWKNHPPNIEIIDLSAEVAKMQSAQR